MPRHQSFHDSLLRGGIKGGRCLIKQKNGRVSAQGSSNTDALTFPAGQRAAALSHDSIETLRKPRNHVVKAGDFAGAFEKSGRHIAHHREVVSKREVEQFGLLEHDRDIRHQFFVPYRLERRIADLKRSAVEVVQPEKKFDQCGFPGSRRPRDPTISPRFTSSERGPTAGLPSY